MNFEIRYETEQDIKAIEAVTTAAFSASEYGLNNEVLIINTLREQQALSISLVAVLKEQIIAHIALSPVEISDGSANWYGLAPVSVLPEYQNQGVGSYLINRALSEIKFKGAQGCVLLGDPQFYKRFGFRANPDLTLEGVPAEYFLQLCFAAKQAKGTVTFHSAFSI